MSLLIVGQRQCAHVHCDKVLPSNASTMRRFCDDKCRAAQWKLDNAYGKRSGGPRSGRNARSGQQISYRKAVDLLTEWIYRLGALPPAAPGERRTHAQRQAEVILRGALPDRQANQLRARENGTNEGGGPNGGR